jgi:hypothetical protein
LQASNLIAHTNGVLETMAVDNPLPNRLQAIAERISADRVAMTANYEWQYTGDVNVAGTEIEVRVRRDDVLAGKSTGRRSFLPSAIPRRPGASI